MAVPAAGQGSAQGWGQLWGLGGYGCSALAGRGELRDSPGKGAHLFSMCDSSPSVLKLTPSSPRLVLSRSPFIKKDFYY